MRLRTVRVRVHSTSIVLLSVARVTCPEISARPKASSWASNMNVSPSGTTIWLPLIRHSQTSFVPVSSSKMTNTGDQTR